jgi:hypothetical protein
MLFERLITYFTDGGKCDAKKMSSADYAETFGSMTKKSNPFSALLLFLIRVLCDPHNLRNLRNLRIGLFLLRRHSFHKTK